MKEEIIEVGLNITQSRELERERKRSFIRFICVFLAVFAFIALVRSFVFFSVQVDGSSMENTLIDGDRLVVDRTGFLERGQVVVFYVNGVVPGETDPDKMFIKRIIGVPGDVIWSEDGVVYRSFVSSDGAIVEQKLDEPYAKGLTYMYLSHNLKTDIPKTVVPENCYFLMGDNRRVSKDCRYFGDEGEPKCVPAEKICGVVPEFVIENKGSKILQILMKYV